MALREDTKLSEHRIIVSPLMVSKTAERALNYRFGHEERMEALRLLEKQVKDIQLIVEDEEHHERKDP